MKHFETQHVTIDLNNLDSMGTTNTAQQPKRSITSLGKITKMLKGDDRSKGSYIRTPDKSGKQFYPHDSPVKGYIQKSLREHHGPQGYMTERNKGEKTTKLQEYTQQEVKNKPEYNTENDKLVVKSLEDHYLFQRNFSKESDM